MTKTMSTVDWAVIDPVLTYHISDDARQKQVLLVFVWALLLESQ